MGMEGRLSKFNLKIFSPKLFYADCLILLFDYVLRVHVSETAIRPSDGSDVHFNDDVSECEYL